MGVSKTFLIAYDFYRIFSVVQRVGTTSLARGALKNFLPVFLSLGESVNGFFA